MKTKIWTRMHPMSDKILDLFAKNTIYWKFKFQLPYGKLLEIAGFLGVTFD